MTNADIHIDLHAVATKTSSQLHDIMTSELGVMKMQDLYNHIHCQSRINETTLSPLRDPPLFVYHRLDYLRSPPQMCKYFKQLATLGI